MQPCREGIRSYASEVMAGVTVSWRSDTMTVELPHRAPVWSSAVWNGGTALASRIVNRMVQSGFDCSDPVAYMKELCLQQGYAPDATVGLMTAAKVTHASVMEEEGDGFSLLCVTTAGTGNAARAGLPRQVYSACEPLKPGTINTIIVLDGRLAEAAVWNAVMTATEAKCAALDDLKVIDRETGRVATGTTTDAVAIAIVDSGRYEAVHRYAGTATTLGAALGRLVYGTVAESVRTQREDDGPLFE
ncbi:adenosylcobinamide amidohydrolase [Paenibacillus dendritiformis]|uniref:adenosylcobinamide amidohydrolase n=1 Tax=Paenibacillus dendritiformis TaxID=130049 RepID=UPI00143D0281|nr:adenosylcobinamide amidohydrolase [Paenibacillus dendritiformis]NKI20106.1 adenosylcobinamide amidohydrolase [Paenibacillus dendritiformis]NRF99009.1 adenosylcobinamide amidohydrolase [Paenibacillus dendritiformis]